MTGTMSRLSNALLLLACSLTLSPIAASSGRQAIPGIVGSDDRQISQTSDYPWSAIGRLNITTGGFCTATVISPYRVLTSAHCLWNKRTGRWFPPCALHFLAGYRRDAYSIHAIASKLEIPAGFRIGKSPAETDWAIVTLDRIVGQGTGTIDIAKGGPDTTERLIQAGYSRDRPHVLTIDSSCRTGDRSTPEGVFTHDCDATFGDSGSPLLTATEGRFELVGIHRGFSILNGKTVGLAVSAKAAANWLETHPLTRPPEKEKACEAHSPTGIPNIAQTPARTWQAHPTTRRDNVQKLRLTAENAVAGCTLCTLH